MTELKNVLTEKGMLKAAVAAAIKEQGREKLASLGFKTMPNGRMALEVASTEGHVITVNLDVTVGVDTNFEKRAKSNKGAAPVEVPNQF